MGTWKLTNFTNARVTWVDANGWDITPPTSPTLDSQTPSFAVAGGKLTILLSELYAQLFLDGAGTPTSLEDLPDDFGIDAITYETVPPWIKNGVDLFTPNFPVTSDDGNTHVIRGGAAQYNWSIQPVGLQEMQIVGGEFSRITLVNPYNGVGYPPVFTKWNGFLQGLLQQGRFEIDFSPMTAQFGAYLLYVFLDIVSNTDSDGNLTIPGWEINGTYNSYPPPPNPTVYPLGGLAFGGAPRIQALTDASGIYTLVPGQYHDELYQRIGTTSSTTVSVMIPEPFFKTGFIGGE